MLPFQDDYVCLHYRPLEVVAGLLGLTETYIFLLAFNRSLIILLLLQSFDIHSLGFISGFFFFLSCFTLP